MNLIGLLAAIMANPATAALFGRPDFYQAIGNFFRGGLKLPGFGKGGAAAPIVPGRSISDFGGWQGIGPAGRPGTGVYGHTIESGGTPRFSIPGAGGGSVDIPNLAAASERGDPFARGAIARQGQSAERMSIIDALIESLNEGMFKEPKAPGAGYEGVPGWEGFTY